MRVPIEGGPSQTMFVAKNLEWWGCLKSPAKLCVIAERSDDRREAVITAFNPEKGRGAELARLKLDPNVTGWIMALSPEGKRIAVIRRPGAPLEILTLSGSILQKIEIPEWSNSGWMTWAPGGNALFVPVLDPEGSRLLRIGLNGGIRVVRKNLGGNFTAAVPSPDSRHIAIESTGDNRNIWLMENFQ